MTFYQFWHTIWHPRCPECALELHNEQEASLHCESCETLKQVNADLRAQNNLLVSLLTANKSDERASDNEPEELEPIRNKHVPWRVLRQQLEERDRLKKAEETDTAKKEKAKIEELEKELLVDIPDKPFADDSKLENSNA